MTVHSLHGCRKRAVTVCGTALQKISVLVSISTAVCVTVPGTALHKTTRLGLAQNENTLYNENKNAVKVGVLAPKQRKAKR